MTVYLARHGQTVWNAQERYQGRLDSPLTDVGRAQAEATAETMGDRGIERLLCSPLGRARAVAGRLDGRTTLIVAHSAINRVLVAALIGWEDRIADIYQPHHVIYRIDRATGATEVTHLVEGVSHPGPYTAGWS